MPQGKDPPVLTQEGNSDQITCNFDQNSLSDLVGFSNVNIAFDYEGYFTPDSNEDHAASIAKVQHKIFVSLGVEAGLLKYSPSSLQASKVSCMGLLGDFNVTEASSGNRKIKAKLKNENEIFMLGLSSLPLDELDVSDEQCVTAKPAYLSVNTGCRPINAAVTAYVAITGNGTIVDPGLLKTSILKYLQKEMKKGELTTNSMPYTAFIGMRDPNAAPGDGISIPQVNNPDQQKQQEQDTNKTVTPIGTCLIAAICIGLIGSFLIQFRRMKKNKMKNNANMTNCDETNNSPIKKFELA